MFDLFTVRDNYVNFYRQAIHFINTFHYMCSTQTQRIDEDNYDNNDSTHFTNIHGFIVCIFVVFNISLSYNNIFIYLYITAFVKIIHCGFV